MRRRAAIASGLGVAALALSVALNGGAGFGRLLMTLGMPSLGASLMPDPAWRGVALYRAGDFEAAAASFAQAEQRYNEANARALAEEYGAALVAYEAVMATAPENVDARTNHAIVSQLYAGTRFENPAIAMELKKRDGETVAAETGQGGARAQGTGAEATNTGTSFEAPELTSSGLREVPRIFDEKYLAASERWLATLDDQPGKYLKARIDAERKRRAKLAEGTR